MTPSTRPPWVILCSLLAACASHPTASLGSHPRQPIALAADPKLVDMTVEATTPLVLANAATELGIRVRITARDLPDAKRPPLNLGLVLDTSGSMEGASIDAVRASAAALVGKLRDGDRISIVAFHSRVDVLVPSLVVSPATRPQLEHAVAGIHAHGTTDLAGGLATALGEVRQHALAHGVNRIVLLSDGVPNTSAQLPNLIAQTHQAGITVTSLGLGVDYDTTLMTQIARDTGGEFHYLEKPEEVATVFDHELMKMTTIVGRGLQLHLAPGPGVTIETMPGFQPAGDGSVYATVGDLPAGETRDLMIPVKVMARGDGSTAELVDATLTFDDVIGASGQHERTGYVGAKASDDAAKVRSAVKISLEVARIRSFGAAAMLDAINLARSGQLGPAQEHLAAAIKTVADAARRLHEDDLVQLAKDLEALGKQLATMTVVPPQIVEDRAVDQPAQAPEAMEVPIRRAEEKANAVLQGHN